MTNTLEIGQKAPEFSLIGADGLIYSSNQIKGTRAFVVFFTCNHCPYVIGQDPYLANLARAYKSKGVEFLAINSNDSDQKPEDSYEMMEIRAKEMNFPWPYLYDRTQSTAKAYGAICTPHFFLFNQNHFLIYSGRALSNPKNPEMSSDDALKNAIDDVLNSHPITLSVTDPIGCSIKWAYSSV